MPEWDPVNADDQMLSIASVAKVFDVKPGTVRKWIATGQLEGIKTRAGWRIRRSTLKNFATRFFS